MVGITGIGSGIDIDSIVTALVNSERAPKESQLNRLEKATTSRISALGSFRSVLSELSTALQGLNKLSAFQKQSISSSSPTVLTATSSADLSPGSFSLQVQQLASSSKVALQSVSGGTAATFNTGELTISTGSSNFSVDVTSANNSLAGIRDAINVAGQANGVSASIVTDASGSRLVLSSNKTGAGNDIQVSATQDGLTAGNNALTSLAFTSGSAHLQLPVFSGGAASTFRSGSMAITGGAVNLNLSIDEGDSLQDIRDAINTAGSGQGVVASIETVANGARLVVQSSNGEQLAVTSTPDDSMSLPAVASASETFTSGTLNLSAGSANLALNVNDGDDLTAIRDAINTQGAAQGFSATIETGGFGARLLVHSSTGVQPVVSAADDGQGSIGSNSLDSLDPPLVGSNGLAQLNPTAGVLGKTIDQAKSAMFSVDGLAVVKDSNSISDVIDGVTINLVSAQSVDDIAAGKTVSITVGEDRGLVRSNLQKFVDTYNKLVQTTSELTAVVQVGEGKPPVTGPLLGDSSIRTLLASMRKEMTQLGDEAGVGSLAELGITTGKDGKLSLDGSKLDTALAGSNYDKVAEFLAGEDGLMGRLAAVVTPYAETGGVLAQRQKGLQSTISGIDKQRAALELRIEKVQARLYSQYNAMDMLVGRLQKTSESLANQLASLPGFVKKD